MRPASRESSAPELDEDEPVPPSTGELATVAVQAITHRDIATAGMRMWVRAILESTVAFGRRSAHSRPGL
jgi:hypothetical protein